MIYFYSKGKVESEGVLRKDLIRSWIGDIARDYYWFDRMDLKALLFMDDFSLFIVLL